MAIGACPSRKENKDEELGYRSERGKRCQRVGGVRKRNTCSHHFHAAYGSKGKRKRNGRRMKRETCELTQTARKKDHMERGKEGREDCEKGRWEMEGRRERQHASCRSETGGEGREREECRVAATETDCILITHYGYY